MPAYHGLFQKRKVPMPLKRYVRSLFSLVLPRRIPLFFKRGRLSFVQLALLLLLALPLPLASEALKSRPGMHSLPAAASERIIRYGMPEIPPLFFRGEEGSCQGYMVDLLRALSEGEPWEVSFVTAHGDELGQMLRRGEIDLLSVVPLPHRDFDLGKVHHYATWYTLFTRPGLNLLSFLDLEGKRIAMQGGFFGIYELRRILNGLGLKYELVETQTVEEAMELLRRGEVDVCGAEQIPTTKLVRRYGFWRSPVVFAPSRIFFGSTKGKHGKLLAELDAKLEAWQKSPFSPLKDIQRRWFYDEEFTFFPEWARWSFWVAALILGLLSIGLGILWRKEKTITLQNLELRERIESEQFLREAAHVLLAQDNREEALREMCRKLCDTLRPHRFLLLRNTFSAERRRALEIFFEYTSPETELFSEMVQDDSPLLESFPKPLFLELSANKVIRHSIEEMPFFHALLPPRALRDTSFSLYPIFEASHLWGALALNLSDNGIPSQGTDVTLETFAEIVSAHRLRKREEKRLFRMATTDALTGLPNRRSFFENLNREIPRCRRHGKPLSVILCDIDFFKNVNDTYGHDAGDYVLRQFGRILRKALRTEDLPARYGGEEFGILLPETDLPEAVLIAERLRLLVEKTSFSGGREKAESLEIHLTASFGVARYEEKEDQAEVLFSRADFLLYEAKRKGRNSVASSPELFNRVSEKHAGSGPQNAAFQA